MRLGLLQYAPRFGEVEKNRRRVGELLDAAEPADLWVLPELFQTGYLFTEREELPRLAEPLDGATMAWLHERARHHHCLIAAGLAEASPEGCFNSAVLVDGASILAHYRKIHLFDREKLWFAPGNLGFPVIEHGGVRLGLMICFDWRFPESARTLAFGGADLILHPSNLVLPWCPDAMVTRALENNVYIATSDRCGDDVRGGQRLHFIGNSQIVDPHGRRLARLGEEDEGTVVVEFDPTTARDKRVTERNHLWEDLRPQFYRSRPA